MLCADLTIVDALNLGDKLQSILDYHFLPRAYSGAQLAAARSLDTDLGVSTGTPYNLSFTQAPGGPVRAPYLDALCLRTCFIKIPCKMASRMFCCRDLAAAHASSCACAVGCAG